MTDAVFQAPKRRAKVHESFEAALPVPLNTEDEHHVFICRAEIIAHHVTVTKPAHIQHLYDRGYFGKGVFSRSRPEHMISQQWKYVGDRCLPVISSSEYEKRLRWARAALLRQGLEDESVSQALQILMKPVEFDTEELIKSHTRRVDGSLVDQMMDTGLNLDQTDSVGPQRQGNPLYDPLAEIYERLKPNVKCRRHDDWVSHCGCRADEELMTSSESTLTNAEPSDAYEYVLVEKSEEAEFENLIEDSGSIVNKTTSAFAKEKVSDRKAIQAITIQQMHA